MTGQGADCWAHWLPINTSCAAGLSQRAPDAQLALQVLRRHIQSHAPAEAKLTFNKLSFVASPYSMARESAINKAASAVGRSAVHASPAAWLRLTGSTRP